MFFSIISKISKKSIFSVSIIAAIVMLLFSCVSAPQNDFPKSEESEEDKIEKSDSQTEEKTDNKTSETENSLNERKWVSQIPHIVYSGGIQRIELEDMFAENFSFSYNSEYSGNFAGRLNNSVSVAKVAILLEEGSYEILAREKASDSDHASFYIFVDNEPYLVSPSVPPLSSFENTTRTPVTFTLENSAEVLITVQANSPHHMGQTGMMIDYLQLKKLP